MNTTKVCSGCGNPFDPRRKGQRFCSATCGNRCRDGRRWHRLTAESASKAASVAKSVETEHSRQLAIVRQPVERRLARQREASEQCRLIEVAVREHHLDRLQVELCTLAANFNRHCGEQGELRALNVELERQVRRLRQNQREDGLDLMFLASRIVLAARDTGFQQDERTRAVFRRRGWSLQAVQRQGQLT
jgi:hypothetical protein